MRGVRAQFSLEYLLIVGLAFILILPVTYYAYTSFEASNRDVSIASATKIGYDVVNNAKSIYYLGNLSKITLQANFPEGIDNIQIKQDTNWKLGEGYDCHASYCKKDLFVITVFDSELAFVSDVPLIGTFTSEDFNSGIKNVVIESEGDFVEIDIR